MKAALYIRVSTLEQKTHGLSVDDQESALIEYCRQNGMEYEAYNDAGISGHTSYKKRPELLRMVRDCQLGKIDIILFTKLDRFFRSVKDYYAVMEQIGDVPWRAIREDYNTDTSSGQFLVNIMLAVAESEAARTSERVKAICEYRQENGDFVGSACTGYDIKKVNGKNTLVKNADAPMIESFFRHYMEDFMLSNTEAKCRAEGFKLSHRLARRIATNRTYTGVCGNATFEPYISEEDFNEIQRQRKLHTRARGNHYTYLFTGLIICPVCGSPLQGNVSSKQPDRIMYRCSHPRIKEKRPYVTIYEADVESFMIGDLDEKLKDVELEYEIKSKEDDSEQKLKNLNDRLERLKLLFEDGDISADEYRSKRNDIKSQIANIKPKNAPPVALPDDWKEMYNQLTRENKKVFWRRVIDHIDASHHGKKFLYTIRS